MTLASVQHPDLDATALGPAAAPAAAPAPSSSAAEALLADPDAILNRLDELEQQVHDLHYQLIHAQRLATLGTLAATIAHEYNNLLTPVLSYAQMALSDPADTPLMRKAVEKAFHGSTQAARISSALLNFTRDTRGTPDAPDTPAATPADASPAADPPRARLPQVVDQTLACLARDPAKDGITLRLNLADAAAAIDPTHLQQVLLNLILNARRAMMPRGGRLAITATTQNDRLILNISDTGPGIPPHLRDRLFEPFTTGGHQGTGDRDQGSEARRQGAEAGGTGLGLALCRTLIEQAGGTITLAEGDADNAPGATFIIDLPRA